MLLNNELNCAKFLEEMRWQGKPHCPHCNSTQHYRTATRLRHPELKGVYKDFWCKDCNKKYNVVTGTIYEASKIGFVIWFKAFRVIGTCKKPISSLGLAKKLNIQQKSAWFILLRIRYVMKLQEEKDKQLIAK